MEKYLESIQGCALFSGIEASQLEVLLGCLMAVNRSYEKNGFIFSAGDDVSCVGVVLSGSVHVLQEDYWGNRRILSRIGASSLFGEAFSCGETESIPVSVLAAERSEILLLDYKRIVTSCSSACGFHTALIQNMMKILARKNIMLTQKMAIVTHRTTRERLLAYLSTQAVQAGSSRFTIPFNRQELSDFLSVERSAMSAELSRMQGEGLLHTNKSEFELLL